MPDLTEEETMDAGALRAALDRDQANTDLDLRDILRHTYVALAAAREPVAPAEAIDPFQFKRGWCAHGNPCRESMCVEYGRREPEPATPAEAKYWRSLYETCLETTTRLAQPPAPASAEWAYFVPYENDPSHGQCPLCGEDGTARTDVEAYNAAIRGTTETLRLRSIHTGDEVTPADLSDDEWELAGFRALRGQHSEPS